MTGDRDWGSWPDSPGAYQQPPRPSRQVQAPPAPQPSLPAQRSGGAEGNERLTAVTGAVLLILLAVEGFTILRIGRLLTLHVFLGMLLLGPVTLKAAAVIYRFARYYTGSALLTACVFGSGIMLTVAGPGNGPWLTLHRLSFIAWFCVMTIHVLAYAPRLPRLLAASLLGGLVIALLTVHLVGKWEPWISPESAGPG